MNHITYIDVLKETLKKKLHLLNDILKETLIQEQCLLLEEVDIDEFEEIILRKEPLISNLIQLDEGFDAIYARVSEILKGDKQSYKDDINQLQELIKSIVDLGVLIESKEKNNKYKLEHYLSNKKREIKNFKLSNNTVSNYYKNMSDTHYGESYFLDKKK